MGEVGRDVLVEELQAMLIKAMDMAEVTMLDAERQRDLAVRTVTLQLQTERYRDQKAMQERLQSLGGSIEGLRETVRHLPAPQRGDVLARLADLTSMVKLVLDGGPERPMLLDELDGWSLLRVGHAAEKKIATDKNRIKDFMAFAGNRPVNRYRYSDFQAFANLLARVPANMSKEPKLKNMSRQAAADYNDALPLARRHETLTGKAIDANYLSPLRMFFRSMAADHGFAYPLADISITIPANAKASAERVPFTVAELNLWFAAAAKERRADLKWLPLLATLTGARVGELIFLQGKDVYALEDSLWVADITTDLMIGGEASKRDVKNIGSRRLFALHSILDQTAFFDYCAKRKDDDWLFPAAFWHGKKKVQDPAGAASKRLNARLVDLKIHKPYETTFHSSRHTAKDIMRVGGVDPRTNDRQTGHAMKSAGDSYGSKTLLVEEVEVLAALPLPAGLDLSPYITKPRPPAV